MNKIHIKDKFFFYLGFLIILASLGTVFSFVLLPSLIGMLALVLLIYIDKSSFYKSQELRLKLIVPNWLEVDKESTIELEIETSTYNFHPRVKTQISFRDETHFQIKDSDLFSILESRDDRLICTIKLTPKKIGLFHVKDLKFQCNSPMNLLFKDMDIPCEEIKIRIIPHSQENS